MMKVCELIEILEKLPDQDAIVDIATDEEGNSFGDIDPQLMEGTLINTQKKVYSLVPINMKLPEEKYN